MTALAITKNDIVAAIKNRHGSVPAFEAKLGLARRSVSDVLRGKKSAKTAEAIATELGHTVESLMCVVQSAIADDSAEATQPHRLNAGGR